MPKIKKKNEIEQCTKIFIYRDLKYYINLIQSQRFETLYPRVTKINKFLDLYDKKVGIPIEIRYDDLKNYLVLRALLEGIKDRFGFYTCYSVTDAAGIEFYYPGFTNLYNILLKFRAKIIIRGRNNAPYEIVDPYIPRAF